MNDEIRNNRLWTIIRNVVYDNDSKPRSIWTDGSPIEFKLSMIDDAVYEILKIVEMKE